MKKEKKGMNPQVKRGLGNAFGSLISNQRAINSAKELPIWVTLIFFILSIALPLIPNMVTVSKTYGSSFTRNVNYGTDTGYEYLTDYLSAQGYEMKVNSDNKLLAYQNGTQISTIEGDNFRYVDKATGQVTLRFCYTTKTGEDLNKFIETYTKTTYNIGTTVHGDSGTYYTPSFVIFSPDCVVAANYKANSTTMATKLGSSSWQYTKKDEDLIKNRFLKSVTEETGTAERTKKVFTNWCDLYDEAYISVKNYTMLTSTMIYLGVYVGMIIFMGLLVFLLTRGKNNIFRYLTFWTCEKISVYAALTPAILGMILAFIITSMGQIFFILMFGIRIMWLTMKQLRPTPVNNS